MNVDLDAIARRGRCDVSSLRIAMPLLEQGYSPPFLSRYRRDELSGASESSLWAVSTAVAADKNLQERRAELKEIWEKTVLSDPSLGYAIEKAGSIRIVERLARRLKQESSDQTPDAIRLAVRVLNPKRGDGDDFQAIAEKVDGINDAAAAVAGLDEAIATRLTGDPRMMSAAVRWLSKHARIHIASISDPHIGAENNNKEPKSDPPKADASKSDQQSESEQQSESTQTTEPPSESPLDQATESNAAAEVTADDAASAEKTAAPVESSSPAINQTPKESQPSEASPSSEAPPSGAPTAESTPKTIETTTPGTTSVNQSPGNESVASPKTEDAKSTGDTTAAEANETSSEKADESTAPGKSPAAAKPEKEKVASSKKAEPAAKKKKKISPRQRRRRWLVSVLKPLAGKRIPATKLSSFQVVMLGRALRSQVAQCAFEYDASKLVDELKRTAKGFNRAVSAKLESIVLEHEANIREAAEGAWWNELHERAASRLADVAADHLRRFVNRGSVDAKVVMSIDAVGPRTAATAIVAADGRVLHCEDIPCQLSAAQRTQAVNKMGELIHTHHVDLIVISNGPARRASMIAVSELIKQSPEKSIRWTMADRSGADAYAGSDVANQEMRKTSRRFRGAAWLAFSVLQPAQAFAKVDPLKLRLASFQRELAEPALQDKLEFVLVSGASRGGVDANQAPQSWLGRLPGMNTDIAAAIDTRRRESRLTSRDEILELETWPDVVSSRQAIPFLRVFGSEEVLDGTLIHPDDYPLAKKLASALDIELPPAEPPGYTPQEFVSSEAPAAAVQGLTEATPEPAKPEVEEFTTTEKEFGEGEAKEKDQTDQQDQTDPSDQTNPSDQKVPHAAEDPPRAEDPPAENPATVEAPADDQPQAAPTIAEFKHARPEQSKIDKCVKEWQIGRERANQLVTWLCDPFGDSDVSDLSHAVMSTMPTLGSLKPGDQVIGVVVGVMPFGVFVELAPDCSGLIHVSKVSETFVEDLHEAVQVGDVITSWVSGVDEKRRRVALSAISPEREIELKKERDERPGRQQRGRGQGKSNYSRGGGGKQGGGARDGSGKTSGTGQSRGGSQSRGGRKSGATGGRTSGGKGGQGRGGRDSRGGRSRDSRGKRQPESYRVVSKPEEKPITEAMQTGAEPLRSFGDLMQFFDKDKQEEKTTAKDPTAESKPADPPATEVASEAPEPTPPDQPPASKPETPAPSDAPDATSGGSSDTASSDETAPASSAPTPEPPTT